MVVHKVIIVSVRVLYVFSFSFLRKVYARCTQGLRKVYTRFTQGLCKVYARFRQVYADGTGLEARQYFLLAFAMFLHLSEMKEELVQTFVVFI